MVRMILRFILQLIANAVGLMVAAYALDDMSISGTAFLVAVLIFTGATIILQPLVIKMALNHANALMGGTALVSTLVGLIVTHLVSDGLSIRGLNTWVLATLIVWLATLLAGIILPLMLFKKALADDRGKGNTRVRIG